MSDESTVPATQTAVVQSAYGMPRDVLTISTSHPVPAPTPNHIQVRIKAASLNPADAKILHGNMHVPGKGLNFPHVPGHDFSGVVTAVGPSVTRFKVGDAVWGLSTSKGTFAEYANIPETAVALKPPSLSFGDAATFPMAAMTALSALEKAEVANCKVVVIGASGGVGLFAVQIAKMLGASSVVGVCSGENAELVKSFGADETVDYKATKLSEAITDKSVDVVFDCVGGKEQFQEAEKVFKSKGRFFTIVGDNVETKISVGNVLSTIGQVGGRKLSGLFSGHQYSLHVLSPTAQMLDTLAGMVKDKGLKTHVDNSYVINNLEAVLGMYTQMESKRTRGKLLLEVESGVASTASSSSATSASTSSTSASSSTASTASTTTTASAASTASTASTTTAATPSTTSSATSTISTSTPATGTVPSSISSVPVSTAIVPNATAENPGVASTDVSTGSIVDSKVEPVPAKTSEGAFSQAAPATHAPAADAPASDAPVTDAPATDAPATE